MVRVLASYGANSGSLRLTYCVEAEPTDNDRQDCELACAELIAQFPEIIRAETNCYSIRQCPASDESVVFAKP